MVALGAAVLAVAGPALATDFRPDGVAVEAAVGSRGTNMAGLGLVWDWDFERMRRKAELTAHTELIINRWRFDAMDGGKDELTQFALLPSLRMRLKQGRSPWYIELGIGASWMDRDYQTPQASFSTRWNFYDVLGIGHTFGGVDGQHELALRWTHVSNGSIREPNPGQDFLTLRYVARF